MVVALTVTKKAESKAAEQGVKLAPDEKELRRWYTERCGHEVPQDNNEDGSGRRHVRLELSDADIDENCSRREAQRKYKHDPLTAIEQQLASRTQTPTQPYGKSRSRSSCFLDSSSLTDLSVQTRLRRESSERERARALIQRKKKELEGNMTPNTMCGDDDEGYRDVYNRQEVKDAHRIRDRKHRDRQRGW